MTEETEKDEIVMTANGGEAATLTCSECSGSYPAGEMVRYGKLAICKFCKPLFFQRVKEGKRASRAMTYGGFWIRFGAKFLDSIIIAIAAIAVSTLLDFLAGAGNEEAGLFLLQVGIAPLYSTLFLGKFQATPGKMATGLIVVSPDGEKIGYGRALGRHFAEIVSYLILCMGYIMAAFDDEKRTLHDRICSTRVIEKQKIGEAF